MYKDNPVNRESERRLAIIETWKILRYPFPIPMACTRSDANVGHQCTKSWEVIDIDIAGCVLCGRIHICGTHQTDSAQAPLIDHAPTLTRPKAKDSRTTKKPNPKPPPKPNATTAKTNCTTVTEAGFTICSITGYCLNSQEYLDSEYTDTVTIEYQSSPKRHKIDHDTVLLYTREILCSRSSEDCLRHENMKLDNRIQNIMFRILKEHKYTNAGKAPNLCTVTTKIAHHIPNTRICHMNFEKDIREATASFCANAITRLMTTLHQLCPHLLHENKTAYIVTGLLYLMRSGLNIHGTTMLPMEPSLQLLLPPESQLQQYFGIKPKCITEVENIVKVNLRVLNMKKLENIGVSNVDKILLKA